MTARQIILTLPIAPSIAPIICSAYSGGDFVVQTSTVNLKKSGGFTAGGGLKVNRLGSFNPKQIWVVKALTKDESVAAQFRELVLLQQESPYLGQVVLTDQHDRVNSRETALSTRSIVGGSTVTIGGIARSYVAARVFIEPAENENIIRTKGCWWVIEFTATEV